MKQNNIRKSIMKTFTKFSLAAVAVLGMSSGAYAATNIDAGVGGTFTTVNTADTLTVTATGGTFVSDDVTVGGTIYGDNNPYNSLNLNTSFYDVTLQAEDDLFLNSDSFDGGYGGIIMQKAGITLMEVNENSDDGTNIYTNTYIATGGVYGTPNTAALGLESGTGAGIGYWDADGDLHGFGVDGTAAIMSGGTNSSVLTLADGDAGGTTLTVSGSDITSINQTVFSATSDAFGYNSVVTVGSALSDSTTTVQGGGADLTLSGSDATLSADNDIVLNVNNDGASYGGLVVNDMGISGAVPLMEIYSNAQGGSDLYSTLDMNGNQIHGVAAGTVGTDAVNLNQLNDLEDDMSKGIAATTAIANIPQVEAGKKASVGLGYGHYNGENAIAAGASWHFGAASQGIMKVSIGTGGSGETTGGVGAAWSW
jgi:hypothetical protein